MPIDIEGLLKPRLAQREVELPGTGQTVLVQSISRETAHRIYGAKDQKIADVEVLLLVAGLAEPQLTEEQVRAWQAASPAGEMNVVAQAILELSGMTEGAVTEAEMRFR